VSGERQRVSGMAREVVEEPIKEPTGSEERAGEERKGGMSGDYTGLRLGFSACLRAFSG